MKRFFAYILACVSLSAGAQSLSIDDCIALALENNKQIEASRLGYDAAVYQQRSARALFFPSISLTGTAMYSTASGSYSSGIQHLPVIGPDGLPTGASALMALDINYDVDWLFSAGVKVQQPIFLGGKIRTGYIMSKLATEIARQNQRLSEADVIVATSQAFAAVVRAREMLAVARSYDALLAELMRTVSAAHSRGVKPRNDVLKVEVKVNESRLNIRRAENALRLASMNLCHYIGRPLTDSIAIDDVLPEVDINGLTADISNRPEHLMLMGKEEIASRNIALARSEMLPQVALIGQYGYSNGIELNGRKLLDSWNFAVGVQMTFSVWDFGRNSNKVRAARAQYDQAVAERADTDEQLTLQLTQAYNNLDEAALELDLATSAVASAEENMRSAARQYQAGTELLSDYLEAQALWQQALETQIDARVGYYLRYLDYLRASGSLN